MLLQPKRTHFRKIAKRGQVKGRGKCELVHGTFGLYSCENARISARQIEAARRSIRHTLERRGTLWIRIFPNRPVTAKPTEVRMGGGSGSIKFWSTVIKKGTMRFELEYPGCRTHTRLGYAALRSGAIKLPMATGVLMRGRILH